jgi:hypothetical protein
MGVPSEKFDAALGHIIEEVEYAQGNVEWTFQDPDDAAYANLTLTNILVLAMVLRGMRP